MSRTKKKYSLTLDDEFIQYCKLNEIVDIEKYAKEVFIKGFTLVKYGDNPMQQNRKDEIRKKWDNLSLVEDLKPMDEVKREKVINLITPNEKQVIKENPKVSDKNKNLYDE